VSLLKVDWNTIERAIEKMLNDHMRTWGSYDYFIIDDVMILVKVYAEGDNRLMFTIKAKWTDKGLEPVEVS
jgi:hypothetical protein